MDFRMKKNILDNTSHSLYFNIDFLPSGSFFPENPKEVLCSSLAKNYWDCGWFSVF
jgi:hypothetical protein